MRIIRLYGIMLAASLALSGCQTWDNFTTYFNTYYNTERLIDESENEFEYQDEKKRVQPRVFIPEPELASSSSVAAIGPPAFLSEFIVNRQKRQPVAVKLDSVIIKGSKILAFHPKSEYVEGSLYLMAKTYFYREEWLPAQIKCGEQIDKFPEGDLSPDAHLLLSKSMLMQRKMQAGNMMLSRTVDIAWQKERYDILSEAFRLQAELALYERRFDDATRPYKRAIAQTGDGKLKAKWQLDLGALLFRMHRFEEAERAFAKVTKYSPDYISEFEAKLYRASSLARLGKRHEAEKMLSALEGDRKYEEWQGSVFAEKMNFARLFPEEKINLDSMETYADSAYVSNPSVAAYYFERGMQNYKEGKFLDASKYFARCRTAKIPTASVAQNMYTLLNGFDVRRMQAKSAMSRITAGGAQADSAKQAVASAYFDMGRVYEQLGNIDSAKAYYERSLDYAQPGVVESARFYYALARTLHETDLVRSDSLLDVIVARYPNTEYGRDAVVKLGYTDAFIIDTVADMYNSGSDLRRYGDYRYAARQYLQVYERWPESDFAPRSLYALGWLYENPLANLDTARMYYLLLISKYPNSIYAQDVKLPIDYQIAFASGAIPDSLKDKESRHYRAKAMPTPGVDDYFEGLDPAKANLKSQQKGMDPRDFIKNPKQLLQKGKEWIDKPVQEIKELRNIKLPTDPSELLRGPGRLMPDSLAPVLPTPDLPDSLRTPRK